MKFALILSTLTLLVGTSAFSNTLQPVFSQIKAQILDPQCASCHAGDGMMSDIAVTDYSYLIDPANGLVVPGHSDQSALYTSVTRKDSQKMPPSAPLSQDETNAIKNWIDLGAKNN